MIDAADPRSQVELFLEAIYDGVGADRAARPLSAGRLIRGAGLAHLLAAWVARVPQEVGSEVLPFERAYPIAARAMADAVAELPEAAARELLALAERELAPGWDHWPADAVQSVRERLGWSPWH
jgi:hypothetical protein